MFTKIPTNARRNVMWSSDKGRLNQLGKVAFLLPSFGGYWRERRGLCGIGYYPLFLPCYGRVYAQDKFVYVVHNHHCCSLLVFT